mgnify:CR=1 FL=1
MKKTKRKIKYSRGLSPAMLLAFIVVLALLAVLAVRFAQRHNTAADEHNGMVQVYNGERNVWIVPQDGVKRNELTKEDFKTDESGAVTYIGGKYKASRGVDVSSYQGDIDWQQVSDSGVSFAIIRAGGTYYGSGELYEDDNLLKNIDGARAAGLRVGVYFFSQAIDEAEARREASYVVTLLEGRKLDLPVFFDWERIGNDTARTDEVENETLTSCAVAFCEQVEASGYKAGVYVYNDTGYYGYDLARLQNYMLWGVGIGSYPYFYYAHDVWQYSYSGRVPGINADCDLDMLFEEK